VTARREVVVTGVGALCALGDAPAPIHAALCAARSGFSAPTIFPAAIAAGYQVAEVPDFNAQSYVKTGNVRPLDRTGRLALVGVELTLISSGWTAARRAATPVGLVLGTMFCSVRTIGEFDRRAQEAGPEYASPLDFSNSVLNAAAGQVAIWQKLRGINSTIATGATSSVAAIGYAAQMIRTGRADALIAGGAEEVCYESFHGARQGGRLAPLDAPEVRPFDVARSGTAVGEGAGFLALEAESVAHARGAAVIARVAGYGTAYDPTCRGSGEMTLRPARHALATAIQQALNDAALAASDIGLVVSSASGSRDLDLREGIGIAMALGGTVPVTAIKSLTGETLGASGALQAVTALQSMQTGRLPGIAGLARLDPAIPINAVAGTTVVQAKHALITAIAPEGNCCAIVLSLR
jgi:3-oxoacyl-[acyl-carrier-protein] synthase II